MQKVSALLAFLAAFGFPWTAHAVCCTTTVGGATSCTGSFATLKDFFSRNRHRARGWSPSVTQALIGIALIS
jgi:hypothetical protein